MWENYLQSVISREHWKESTSTQPANERNMTEVFFIISLSSSYYFILFRLKGKKKKKIYISRMNENYPWMKNTLMLKYGLPLYNSATQQFVMALFFFLLPLALLLWALPTALLKETAGKEIQGEFSTPVHKQKSCSYIVIMWMWCSYHLQSYVLTLQRQSVAATHKSSYCCTVIWQATQVFFFYFFCWYPCISIRRKH